MKILKKLILSVFVVICFSCIKVNANDIHVTSDGIKIQCDYYNKTASVVGYEGEPTIINIPSEYDGCNVDTISEEAFSYSKTIQVVNIPNTINKIGEGAFCDCKNLTKVNFSSDCDIKKLSSAVFSGCTKLSEITYPTNGFVEIGSSAFGDCSLLKNLYISDRTEQIGDYAFYNTGIDKLNITSSVKSIGEYAYSACENLVDVSISQDVESLGNSVFKNCKNLVTVNIQSDISDDAFMGCSRLKNVILGEHVEKIGRQAFYGTAISKIVIPYSVKSVGIGAFNSCIQLTDVYAFSKNIKWYEGYDDYNDNEKMFSNNSKVTLHGIAGSGTDNCAQMYGINFVPIDYAQVNIEVNNTNEAVLKWSAVDSAQKYIVYRSEKENGDYTVLSEIVTGDCEYIDKNVERGKTYYYFILSQKLLDNELSATVQSNIVKAKIDELVIKLSCDNINVNKTATLYLWTSKAVKNVEYRIDDPQIVSAEWGDNWSGNKVELNLYGEKKGSTKITISNDYNSDIAELYVTVSQARIKLSKVNIHKWEKVSKKNAYVVKYKIKWDKVKNANGYEVIESLFDRYLKTWSSEKYTVKKNSYGYSTSRLDTAKVKIKVRAYRYEGNKKIYGAWSNAKTTNIKF